MFAVWGDSHADALMPPFERLARERGASGLYLGRIGCPPLLGVERPNTNFQCRAFNDAALQQIKASRVETVVLVARWPHYSSMPTYGRESRTRVVLSEDDRADAKLAGNDAILARGLRRTVRSLEGRSVYLVAGIPEIGYDVPEVLARMRHLGRRMDIRPTWQAYEERQHATRKLLESLEQEFGFMQLHPSRVLCDARRCEVARDGLAGGLLYFDSHHLSGTGAMAVAGELEPVFGPRRDEVLEGLRGASPRIMGRPAAERAGGPD